MNTLLENFYSKEYSKIKNLGYDFIEERKCLRQSDKLNTTKPQNKRLIVDQSTSSEGQGWNCKVPSANAKQHLLIPIDTGSTNVLPTAPSAYPYLPATASTYHHTPAPTSATPPNIT